MNESRIREIASGALRSDWLGRACWVNGVEGRIDAMFIDLRAAISVGLIDEQWFGEQPFRMLEMRKGRPWYSVVLPHGAVLVAQEEISEQLRVEGP